MSRSEHLITFDLEYHDNKDKKIPVSVLTKTLSAAQRIVNILASEIDIQNKHQRDEKTQDAVDRYSLYIEDISIGSAHSCLRIGNPNTDAEFSENRRKIVMNFKKLNQAIQNQDHELFESLFESKKRLNTVLNACKDYIPDPKLDIMLTVGVNAEHIVMNSKEAIQNINSLIKQEDEFEGVIYIIGRLNRILFDKNEFQFYHKPTRKNHKVRYPQHTEYLLLNNPRNYIQIFGTAVLDNNMDISQIKNVEKISEVDLSPIRIENFQYDGDSYHVKKTITLQVFLDNTEQFFCVKHNELALNLASETREELIEDILEKLSFLWRFYVQEDIQPCLPEVTELKKNLNQYLEKTNG